MFVLFTHKFHNKQTRKYTTERPPFSQVEALQKAAGLKDQVQSQGWGKNQSWIRWVKELRLVEENQIREKIYWWLIRLLF